MFDISRVDNDSLGADVVRYRAAFRAAAT